MSDNIIDLGQRRIEKRQAIEEAAHQRGEAFGFSVWPFEHFSEDLSIARSDDGAICILRMYDELNGDAMTPADVRRYAKELLELADAAECNTCNPLSPTDDDPPCAVHFKRLADVSVALPEKMERGEA